MCMYSGGETRAALVVYAFWRCRSCFRLCVCTPAWCTVCCSLCACVCVCAAFGPLVNCCYSLWQLLSGAGGGAKNKKKAFGMLTQAADLGFAPAMYSLALCYTNGDGVKKSPEDAFRLFL